ncbi:MAG: peptidylprolyl isomerase [Jhaorihella sp.]
MACAVRRVVAAAIVLAAPAVPAAAQSLFSPAIRVNDEAITHFELEQRILFMQLLRIPGDPETLARKALIEERLKRQATKDAGIAAEPEAIKAGIEELSSRTQLSAEEFVKALGEAGVAPETLRDFVRNGIDWRDYVTQRFLSQARPSEEEIDRAMARGGSGGGIQVLLSEVIMPVTPDNIEQVDELAAQISGLTSYDAFSKAASLYSATDTRNDGGRLGWLDITKLPAGLQPVIMDLKPGEVSSPIALPNAVALFQMRGIRETTAATPRYATIDYAMYLIAGGRSAPALAAAQAVRDRVDTCNDLYGVAKGQPPQVLERLSLPPGQIPQDIALELAKLDENEISTALTRSNGTALVVLMLCSRNADLGDAVTREQVANALTQQRLATYADSYLQQLLAEARIVDQ